MNIQFSDTVSGGKQFMNKQSHIHSTDTSMICGVAVDQGSGLGAALKSLRGEQAQDDDLFQFKCIMTQGLSPYANTLLVDAHYGRKLLPHIQAPCAPMLAYEADVYHISDDDRMTVLPDNLTIADYEPLGVKTLKFFLYYAPDDDQTINQKKHELVMTIGKQCREQGIQFLFEPIVYDRAITDTNSLDFIRKKPDLVARATAQFAAPLFQVDVFKVEMPINFSHMHLFDSQQQVTDAFATASQASGNIPMVYLSAGVSFEVFAQGLRFAKDYRIPFDGFMCGRAIWGDAIEVFGNHGIQATKDWIHAVGIPRLQTLKDIVS